MTTTALSSSSTLKQLLSTSTVGGGWFSVFAVSLVICCCLQRAAAEDPFATKAPNNSNSDPFATTAPNTSTNNEDLDDDDVFVSENPWAKYNWDATSQISHYTAALSVFGSASIIVEILKDRKKRRLSYHRIMLGLSLYDLMSSIWFFIGAWANETDSLFSTTSQACVASGFFIYLGSIGIPLYNTALAVYFFLTVRWGWREQTVRDRFERYCHIAILILALAFAIPPIPLELYNPYYSFCFVTSTFERGNTHQAKLFWILHWTIVFGSALCVTSFMVSIFLYVRTVIQKSHRFTFEGSRKGFSDGTQSSSDSRHKNDLAKWQHTKTRQVRTMALLYTLPFYMTWVVPCMWFIISYISYQPHFDLTLEPLPTYVMNVYIATALPLQGFFNWMIYMLPRFKRLRHEHPQWRLGRVLANMCGHICQRRQEQEPQNDNNDEDNESLMGSMIESIQVMSLEQQQHSSSTEEQEPQNDSNDEDNESSMGSMMESIQVMSLEQQEHSSSTDEEKGDIFRRVSERQKQAARCVNLRLIT